MNSMHKIVLEILSKITGPSKYVTMTYKYYEVIYCVILNQYPTRMADLCVAQHKSAKLIAELNRG